MFRKATPDDLDRIVEIYDELHTEQEKQNSTASIGWKRGVYPTKSTAEIAISTGEMFVEEVDGVIVASARINQVQLDEYVDANWENSAPDDEIMVLHTLAVSPKVKRNGYGAKFMKFYEQYSLENGCPYLRIDTWEKNLIARALYKKLGYNEVGVVVSEFNGIGNFRLVCLEKKLDL